MGLSGHASQSSIYSTIIALTVLSFVAVVLRLITRLTIVKQSGWDDVFISIACILSIIMGVSMWKQTDYGMGIHMQTLPPSYIRAAFSWFWNFLWLYYGSLCFTKLSILLLYLRIFPHRTFTISCYVLIAIVSAWSCWAVFSSIFTCVPVSKFWTELELDAPGCLPRLTLWYFNAAMNIATDCATALLPLPILNSLDIPRKQKMILMCVFAIGLFTCMISVLRLVYIYPLSVSPDATWNTPLPTIWSCVEANTAILCACIPTLKGLVQRFFPKLLDSMRSQPVSDDSAATDSTRDSVMKKGVKPEVAERDLGSKRHLSKRDSVNGSRTSRAFHSRNRSNASSEEATVEYEGVGRTFYIPEDQDIYVQTSVDQMSEPRRPEDPKPPKRYEPVRGIHRTQVSGAGRESFKSRAIPNSPNLWKGNEEIRHALGIPGSKY